MKRSKSCGTFGYRLTDAWRPDITIIEARRVLIIDVAIPGDSQILEKEQEKVSKYRDPCIELTRIWMKHVKVLPIVIGALGTISTQFSEYFAQLDTPAVTPVKL